MIEPYKPANGALSVDIPYIELDVAGSRGHEFNLKGRAAKAVRFNFSMRIAKTWIRLPSRAVDAPTINSFNGRLDHNWTQYRYSQDSVCQMFSFMGSLFEWPKLQTTC